MFLLKEINFRKVDKGMIDFIVVLRYVFISIMIAYLIACLWSLAYKVLSLTVTHGALDFASIKMLLTDGLFTLIVLAIVKTLFIADSFEYAITFLEIAFVVIIRKLILIETTPEETSLLLVLGIISAVFLLLIVFTRNLKNRWACLDRQKDEAQAEPEEAARSDA